MSTSVKSIFLVLFKNCNTNLKWYAYYQIYCIFEKYKYNNLVHSNHLFYFQHNQQILNLIVLICQKNLLFVSLFCIWAGVLLWPTSHQSAQARQVKRSWSSSPQCFADIESTRICIRTGGPYMLQMLDAMAKLDNVIK